ncbi:MAG: hypothetical protein LBJ67_05195 [Planctomycetaceae bacterium]|nr:hypothetical protein [Planctomycetaceae bacterium]
MWSNCSTSNSSSPLVPRNARQGLEKLIKRNSFRFDETFLQFGRDQK